MEGKESCFQVTYKVPSRKVNSEGYPTSFFHIPVEITTRFRINILEESKKAIIKLIEETEKITEEEAFYRFQSCTLISVCRVPLCVGCRYDMENQLAHVDPPYGCMYTPSSSSDSEEDTPIEMTIKTGYLTTK